MTYMIPVRTSSAADCSREFLTQDSLSLFGRFRRVNEWLVKIYVPDVKNTIRNDPFMVLALPFFVGMVPFLVSVAYGFNAIAPIVNNAVYRICFIKEEIKFLTANERDGRA